MMKLCLLRLLAGLLLLPLVAACSTPQPGKGETTYDQQFDFSTVHKVTIEPFSRTDPATITISDARIKRINDAIAGELQRKGFAVLKDAVQADLLITWYLISKGQMAGGSNGCPGCDAYAGGTLIVDMTDIMRNKPVWRSVYETSLDVETDPGKLERERSLAAQAVFANFPPQ